MEPSLPVSSELRKELAALEKSSPPDSIGHEALIIDVLRRIMQLLNPPPEPEMPQRHIGFKQP